MAAFESPTALVGNEPPVRVERIFLLLISWVLYSKVVAKSDGDNGEIPARSRQDSPFASPWILNLMEFLVSTKYLKAGIREFNISHVHLEHYSDVVTLERTI
ncbi:uncharacterized protein BT62DRAFT_1007708 [Guyanagaster necrorhizus]|uniref:Uncharacterized protein n=1 Tax=Guyanagaster necrorhizus TaxID=856835 RepID=A0A9P7VNX3_9AGAR|nr:uncharacterized protein BT62DRAFT_1007708 [Guyanagaster necrorhizus MCA 3950]KAG7444673.1 hypothetical protein BT62DRAFT_1007708 [Guyanagaster necrorhizus MCA 3950]